MKKRFWQFSLVAIAIILLADLALLNWKILNQPKPTSESSRTQVTVPSTPRTITSEAVCPTTCLSQIYEATVSLKLSTPIPQKETTATSQIKEAIITLGSGSTKAGDWEDIAGLAVYIDSGKYGKIKSVVFEAAVSIPNGNQGVYIRLFNATDKHPVWFSEVYHEGGTAKLLVSSPITLDLGNKLYQVQMKTTLKDLANLNQARVRITTE